MFFSVITQKQKCWKLAEFLTCLSLSKISFNRRKYFLFLWVCGMYLVLKERPLQEIFQVLKTIKLTRISITDTKTWNIDTFLKIWQSKVSNIPAWIIVMFKETTLQNQKIKCRIFLLLLKKDERMKILDIIQHFLLECLKNDLLISTH